MEQVYKTSQLRTTYHEPKSIAYLARKEYDFLVTIHKQNIEHQKAIAIVGTMLVHGFLEATGYVHLMAAEHLRAAPLTNACGYARLLPKHAYYYQATVTSLIPNRP